MGCKDFHGVLSYFLERIEKEEKFPKEELISAIGNVWENFFPIGEEGDLAYCLGSLLVYFGYDRKAIELFQTSLEFYGEDAAINYEIAVCYYNMQVYDKAMEWIEKSLLLESNFEQSITLRSMIDGIRNTED